MPVKLLAWERAYNSEGFFSEDMYWAAAQKLGILMQAKGGKYSASGGASQSTASAAAAAAIAILRKATPSPVPHNAPPSLSTKTIIYICQLFVYCMRGEVLKTVLFLLGR